MITKEMLEELRDGLIERVECEESTIKSTMGMNDFVELQLELSKQVIQDRFDELIKELDNAGS